MHNLNELISQIEGSPTLALNDKAKKLRQAGADVINLGIGEPLNDMPEAAMAYSQKILSSRQIKYGPVGGAANLKLAIQEYTKEHYGRTPDTGNITVNIGAKQALYNLLNVILNPLDEVILIKPYWVSYPEMVKLARGTSVLIDTDENFMPDLDKVSAAINKNTKAIIVNSPNNPTGAVYPPELIAALVDLAETKKIFLIMDDIYHQLVFEPAQWVPGYVFTSQPIDKSHLIIINGVSKSYGMTGFRIGWTIAPASVIQAMEKIQSHSTSGASSVLQEGALGALQSGNLPIQTLKKFIQGNRDILIDQLKSIPGLKLAEPQGTFYCFPDLSGIHPDSEALASHLLEKAFVSTVPGKAFGMEGYLRLSYTCSKEEITESAARIRWAVDLGSPREIMINGQEHLRDWETLE